VDPGRFSNDKRLKAICLDVHAVGVEKFQENRMNQIPDDEAARLAREHEAVTDKLTKLREEARRLGKEFEEKFRTEILEAEVELTRLSALLGKIGL
jgi:hypothetical protein